MDGSKHNIVTLIIILEGNIRERAFHSVTVPQRDPGPRVRGCLAVRHSRPARILVYYWCFTVCHCKTDILFPVTQVCWSSMLLGETRRTWVPCWTVHGMTGLPPGKELCFSWKCSGSLLIAVFKTDSAYYLSLSEDFLSHSVFVNVRLKNNSWWSWIIDAFSLSQLHLLS